MHQPKCQKKLSYKNSLLLFWHLINTTVIPGLWVKADCGLGRLYSQMSFLYKYKMLHGFIKGVSGGCFVLIKMTLPTIRLLPTIQVRRTQQLTTWADMSLHIMQSLGSKTYTISLFSFAAMYSIKKMSDPHCCCTHVSFVA